MAGRDEEDCAQRDSRPLVAVVDDDDAVLRSLHNLLTSAGWRVATFASAEAFLGAEARRDVRCLVLDLRMPGMGGAALLAQLAGHERAPPTIILTADGSDEVQERLLALGAIAFFVKPYRASEMLAAVGSALSAAPTRS